jgi:hypothetical protein
MAVLSRWSELVVIGFDPEIAGFRLRLVVEFEIQIVQRPCVVVPRGVGIGLGRIGVIVRETTWLAGIVVVRVEFVVKRVVLGRRACRLYRGRRREYMYTIRRKNSKRYFVHFIDSFLRQRIYWATG